jgi:hypothetical protein
MTSAFPSNQPDNLLSRIGIMWRDDPREQCQRLMAEIERRRATTSYTEQGMSPALLAKIGGG